MSVIEFFGSTKQKKTLMFHGTINICFILLTIYMFIPVSGCGGRGPSALFCPRAYNAVQTLSHNVVHLALIEIRTHNISGDRH
jgi:hypothetical protein